MTQATPRETALQQSPFNGLAQAICVLASFPLVAFHTLRDVRAKGDVIMRGLAVFIAPTVSAYFLFRHGEAVFAMAAFFLLLPALSALLDWRITAGAYQPSIGQGLRPIRYGLALVTASIAFVGALTAERQNLMKALHEAELQTLAKGDSIYSRDFAAVQDLLAQARNSEAELIRKQDEEVPRLQNLINQSRMLHTKECYGVAGVDASTGVQIKGGQCGPRAAAHKADMDAAERSLSDLKQQIETRPQIAERIDELKTRARSIVKAHLSPENNIGSLVKAIEYASLGVLASVALQLCTVLFFELLCVIVSHITPPDSVIKGIELVAQMDTRRMEALQRKLAREMNRDEPTPRFDLKEDRLWSKAKSWMSDHKDGANNHFKAIGDQS